MGRTSMATAPPQPEPPKVWMFVSKVRQYFPSVFQNRNLSWPKQGQGTNDWGGDLTGPPGLLAPQRVRSLVPVADHGKALPTTKRSQRPRDLRSPFPGALRGGSSLYTSLSRSVKITQHMSLSGCRQPDTRLCLCQATGPTTPPSPYRIKAKGSDFHFHSSVDILTKSTYFTLTLLLKLQGTWVPLEILTLNNKTAQDKQRSI